MFNFDKYLPVLLAINSGILTLLGFVGIFISLIVQRRVERLQDILEEFMDLSYHKDINLTGKMFKLLQKYQMQYMLPDKPSQTILNYTNFTIAIVITNWSAMLISAFEPPWRPESFIYLLPIIGALILLIFFRQLLKYAINPVRNQLLQTIIPPPTKLRSLSFLSSYINVSVSSILAQARLSLVVRLRPPEKIETATCPASLVLKEELSFDDFFYYVELYERDSKDLLFIGFGEVVIDFKEDPITNKPIPIRRNVNIPMGNMVLKRDIKYLDATLLLFSRSEKHPLEYTFYLKRAGKVLSPEYEPEVTTATTITYRFSNNEIEIIDCHHPSEWLEKLSTNFKFQSKKWYLTGKHFEKYSVNSLAQCEDQVFIK
ncbi:hypothetical protein GGQ84_001639 [Desulfitispora alkaliphila]|uniref:hypothetical protein n=1 Tax=Desulfitispora alkaliphila TaxID=622674 RepID=UPI003D20881E